MGRSMNEKSRSNTRTLINKARPGSFSSYQSLLNHRDFEGDVQRERPVTVFNGVRSLNNSNRYYSDSSLASRDNTMSHDGSRDSSVMSSLSRDSSFSRTREELMQQLVVLPGEKPPDF